MNSLFSKCYPLSIKTFKNVFKNNPLRHFTTNTVNPLANLNCSFVTSSEDKETLSKLVEKDLDYFVNLSENKGAEEVLRKLTSISERVDANTKLGRELLNTRNEIVKRVVYYNRSIEDHENVSNHICEKELYQVYAEHLKQLNEKLGNVEKLQENSRENSKVIYEYNQSLFTSKYFLSPFLIFWLPSVAISNYHLYLEIVLGSAAPSLLILGSIYLAARRYKWLTSSSYIRDGHIAKKVKLEDQNNLVIESLGIKKKTFRFNLNSVKIQLIENAVRRESFYLIKDLDSKKTFILPLDDKAVADRKFINWLSAAKNDDKYSITSTLSKGNNLIDLSANKRIGSEIDNFARLNMLAELNPGFDLSTLTPNELHEKLNNISDNQVKEYLQRVRSEVQSGQPAIETSLVEVENFLASHGLSNEEAVNTTKYLRKDLRISGLSDLKNLNKNEVIEALEKNCQKTKSELDALVIDIQLFFRKF